MQKNPNNSKSVIIVLDEIADQQLDKLAADLNKSRSETIRILINQEFAFRGLAQKEA